MSRAIRSECSRPDVRDTAARIVRGCGPRGFRCRIRRVLEWVRTRVEYIPDPIGVEAVGLASFHLERIKRDGVSFGDCDCAATLIGSLLRAVGFRVRLAAASFLPDRRLHHVWAEAFDPSRGCWVEVDPFRSERFSDRPTRLVYVGT